MMDEIRRMLAECSAEQRHQIFEELKEAMPRHAFESRMNSSAAVILEALDRASDLSLRGIRGLIGEAIFVLEIVPALSGWKSERVTGDAAYDASLCDEVSSVTVQVKMQRREKGLALIKKGTAIVEVQRTRNGLRKGKATRPYNFGEFDILAVCMEPSHGRWNSFHYAPERWLKPRAKDATLVQIMQPVSLVPDAVWTDDFSEAVRRLRSGLPRPA